MGKLKRIGNQGEAKINEMNIHTIADFQRYVQSHGFSKLPIQGFIQIYEYGLEDLPGETMPSIKDHRKAKNVFLEILREMGREIKVILLNVKILLYH